jgi:hypothetical protein
MQYFLLSSAVHGSTQRKTGREIFQQTYPFVHAMYEYVDTSTAPRIP